MSERAPHGRRYRLLRRIRHRRSPSLYAGGVYGEWHSFGTRQEMEFQVAREIARCLRAIAVDDRYQYVIVDTTGNVVEDETGTPVQPPEEALAS